ncbi:MAG: hypothetical protein VYE68_13830 [Acidobacteriota bacterium]|nr:hypothetical protein [Acidobacteriota bacterium]
MRKMKRRVVTTRGGFLVLVTLGLAGLATTTTLSQRGGVFRESRDHPAIQYTDGERNDVITRLVREVNQGATTLEFDPVTGYLPSVLDALDIPIESQVTVFSETSFQAEWITPENPRALYFNDTAAVGWVRGADVLEVAVLDPTQGVGFYSIDQVAADRPTIKRNEVCLACHLSWDTLGVPGLMTLNTLPLPDDPNAYAVGWVTDHRSPLEDRWGSWYVTGAPEGLRHLGNQTEPFDYIPGGGDPAPVLDTLSSAFDPSDYLTPYSDLVALLVLEHRNHMTNLIIRLGWQTRVAKHPAPVRNGTSDTADAASTIDAAAAELVDYLLFIDEVSLPEGIASTSGFADVYSSQGPFDTEGRSLHELDLQNRLLRYPCSPLIYTAAFDALPTHAKVAVYQRMWNILSGAATEDRYQRLTREERTAIVEILQDTKPGLPDYFRVESVE